MARDSARPAGRAGTRPGGRTVVREEDLPRHRPDLPDDEGEPDDDTPDR